jgi:C1A family cysteine protease
MANRGLCPESLWPYDTSKVDVAPPAECDAAAASYKVHQIGRVCDDYASAQEKISAIEKCVSSGLPVLIGISVYESFESDEVAATGTVPMPNTQTEQLCGGHEVLIVGYNSTNFQLVNSWGPDWGDAGFFTLPYAYVTDPNLTSEFILITRV